MVFLCAQMMMGFVNLFVDPIPFLPFAGTAITVLDVENVYISIIMTRNEI